MSKVSRTVKVILLLLLLVFCVDVFADEKVIIKTPGIEKAIIYARSNFDKKKNKIGETPYQGSLKNLLQRFAQVNVLVIDVEKKGYETQSFVIMKGADYDVNLKVKLKSLYEIGRVQKIDLMISQLFKIQGMIRSQKFDEAIRKLEELEKDFGNFSIIPELQGIVLYMKKDIEKALGSFRKSFAINPKNADAYKMKIYLEKKLGIDTVGN